MSSNYSQSSENARNIEPVENNLAVANISEFSDTKGYLENLLRLEQFDINVDGMSDVIEKTQVLIYRFSVLFDANIEKYQQFRRQIEWIKSANPRWEVMPDMPKLGEESEAWIMIYRDENYLNGLISYLAQ